MFKMNVRIHTGQDRRKWYLWQPLFSGEGRQSSGPHISSAEAAYVVYEKELQSGNRIREFQIDCNFFFCPYWDIQILAYEVSCGHKHWESQFC